MHCGARLVAGLSLAMSAAGCAGGGTADGVVELRVWAFGSEGEALAPLAREFEQSHPAVRVRVQQIPWTAAHEKLLTAYVGDEIGRAHV